MDAEDERELLKKIRALEEDHAELKRQVSKLQRPDRRGSSSSHQPAEQSSSASRRTAWLSARHHMMAMQALGQAAHVLDLQGRVLYWNRNAERLYHYSSAEAVGQDITRLIIHPDDIPALNTIIGNIFTGECWRGKFPVRNKSGERFIVVADATPLHDDDGSLMGLICLADDADAERAHWSFGVGILLLSEELTNLLHWCSLLHTESSLKSLEVSLTALTTEDVGVGIPETVGVPGEEKLCVIVIHADRDTNMLPELP